jgi:hypothetical protein
MHPDDQLGDRISRWLEGEAPGQMPDRVLSATFERTRASRQHGRYRALLGRMQMNRTVLGLAGAAAVVLVAAVALNADPAPAGVGGPASPVASPSPSPTPSPSSPPPSAASVGLPQASHVLWTVGVRMDVTIPAPGWFGDANNGILTKNEDPDAPDGAGLIVFAGDPGGLYVYGDPCSWSTTRPTEPAGTVDELVAALTAQALRDATSPVDITIDGHPGKSITLHVPEDAIFADCDEGTFASWGVQGEDPARWHQDPGQIDELSILDVDGELVVLDGAYYEGTPTSVVDELRALIESTTFGE